MSTSRTQHRRQAGLTMVELIMFILIVSVGIVGILTVLNVAVKSSADPMIRKNMLAIAEALIEEVQLMPFTWCDPDDANAATAMSAAGCASMIDGLGREGAETNRIGNAANPFDNVSDYDSLSGTAHGLGNSTTQITNLDGTAAAPLGYTASIAIATDANLGTPAVPAADALRIAVTVTYASDSIVVEGYRTRYAPNFLP